MLLIIKLFKMKKLSLKAISALKCTLILSFTLVLFFHQAEAQKKGGGKPAPSHSAPASRPSAPSKTAPSKPAPSKPAVSSKNSGPSKPSKPDVSKNDLKSNNKVSNSGNKTNNVNSGNKNVSIDNSKKNVNVNVDKSKDIKVNNSRNTTVRRNSYHPYTRPPYRYGGHRYYCYQPYHYHPYRPYAWGPVYHPWGFFAATLAATAIILTVESQQYHYDQGVYYAPSNGGYTVVAAPVGATITTLPPNTQTVVVNETTNNYYYGGTYYEKSSGGYTVVPPTAGTIVENLPDGGKEVKMGNQTYVQVGDTYYQPIQQNGKDYYEVAEVEVDD
jgi:hypothetical protein